MLLASDRLALLERLETEGRVIGFESEMWRKDGNIIWVSENVSAVRDETGVLKAIEGSMVDITQQKRAVRELKDSELRYRELVDFLPQPVFELDPNGVPTYVNGAALDWYGSGVEEMMVGGAILLKLVVAEDEKLAADAFARALGGEQVSGIELTAIRGDGERVPVLVFASPMNRDGVPSGARILGVDISSLKNVEKELRKIEQTQAAVLRSPQAPSPRVRPG